MLGLVVVGVILPVGALALGVPLAIACTVRPPPRLARRGAGDEAAALNGALSAQVVEAIHGAPDLLAFGADAAMLDRIETLSAAVEALDRRQAAGRRGRHPAHPAMPGGGAGCRPGCGGDGRHAHHLNPVMVAVLPLAALGTFEPIPGLAQAAARARAVSAAAQRLLDLETVPVPVHRPGRCRAPLRRGARRSPSHTPPCATRPIGPGPSTTSRSGWSRAARLAVTGSSGAGKSSLVNVLLRFWPLEEGALTVGEHPGDPALRNQRSGPPAHWSTREPSSSPGRCTPT